MPSPHPPGTRERFAEVVRREPVDLATALVLLAAEAAPPDADDAERVPLVPTLAHLDALAADARDDVEVAVAQGRGAADGLRRALGERAGFGGGEQDYGDVRASLLPEVLGRRRGLPILLGVVWVEVARRLDVPAHCLATPGHVLVLVDGRLVDPFAGGHAVPDPGGRAAAYGRLEPLPLLLRVTANLRALSARLHDPRLGLWACELGLLLPHHPLSLRREHGLLLARAGRFAEGAAELESYAEVAIGEDAAAAAAEARTARARLN